MVSLFETGNGVVLLSAMSTPGKVYYLDSSPTAGKSTSVYLSETSTHSGCYWQIHAMATGGRIRLVTVATGSDRTFLDSSAGAPKSDSVYLANRTAGGGSHWLPTLLDDGNYSFKSDTPSGSQKFMYANPTGSKEESVYMVSTAEQTNARWKVLFTYYIGDSVRNIISAVYPSVLISTYEPNATYGSLAYDRLHSIWKDTQLGDNQIAPHASDFAVCLKAEVYKYSSKSDSPWPNDKGSLCGIMWGSIGGKMCALNFTIDPFQNLILFDPQSGQKKAIKEFTPTFCMV